MIAFCNISRTIAAVRSDMDAAVRRVFDRAVFIGGPEVDAFEHAWSEYCGVRHTIACASGTDALTLIGLSFDSEHKAMIPANTLPCTKIGLGRSCAVEVRDIDMDGRLQIHGEESVPVLLYGRYPQFQETILSWRFDGCQAHGWKPPENATVAWSGYPTKNLGGIGDGGWVTTNDSMLHRRMRDALDITRTDGFRIQSRMSELQAAVLRVKLKCLDDWNAERGRLAGIYYQELPQTVVTATKPDEPSNHHLFAVLTERREQLVEHLLKIGIQTKRHYSSPLGPLPNATRWCDQVLSLPLWVGMTDSDVREVCDGIRSFQ